MHPTGGGELLLSVGEDCEARALAVPDPPRARARADRRRLVLRHGCDRRAVDEELVLRQ